MGSSRDELFDNTFTYERWDCGNRTSFTLTQNGEVLQSVAYTYDDLNRLTTVSENGAQQAAYTATIRQIGSFRSKTGTTAA